MIYKCNLIQEYSTCAISTIILQISAFSTFYLDLTRLCPRPGVYKDIGHKTGQNQIQFINPKNGVRWHNSYFWASRVKNIQWTIYQGEISYRDALDLPKLCVFHLTNIHPDIQYPRLITQRHVVKAQGWNASSMAPVLNLVQMWPWIGAGGMNRYLCARSGHVMSKFLTVILELTDYGKGGLQTLLFPKT